MCFQNDGKTTQAAKCTKSKIMNKLINCVLFIDTHEKRCVELKCMLQSPRHKYHVKTIGVDQSKSNNSIFKHVCFQNINKLYKHASKFDDQQQFKDIIEAGMVSNPEGFTNNSTRSPYHLTRYGPLIGCSVTGLEDRMLLDSIPSGISFFCYPPY